MRNEKQKVYSKRYRWEVKYGRRDVPPHIDKLLDKWVEKTAREIEKLDREMYDFNKREGVEYEYRKKPKEDEAGLEGLLQTCWNKGL